MSGPRDLRRGGKKLRERADPLEAIGGKSHYVCARWGTGFAITINRRGRPVETVMCKTEGEVNQVRRRLTDEGLIGYNERAQ